MSAFLWYSTLFVAFIFALIQVYACHHFKSLQSLLAIKKRYPQIVLTEAIAVLIWLLTAFPLWANLLFQGITFGLTDRQWTVYAIVALSYAAALTHFVLIIEVSRLWLISFDLHCLHSSQNEKWKSQIDESFAKKDWYLRHRNTFGNQKYLIRRALIYYLCIAVLSISLYWMTFIISSDNRWRFIATLTDGFLFLISVGISLYIYYKCRDYNSLNDNLYFWYEIRATSIIWAVCILCYFAVQLLHWFFSDKELIKTIYNSLFAVLSLFATVAPSFLSTLVIPLKVIQSNIWKKEALNRELYSMNSLQSVASLSMGSVSVGSDGDCDLLHETLRNEKRFELFIHWMYREFSAENALCFIEVVQFKKSMIAYLEKKNESKLDVYDTQDIDLLYSSVPRSSIVFAERFKGVDEIAKYRLIAHKLYAKYICPNAELEVNISHKLRLSYIKLDKDNWKMAHNELVQVFDKVMKEMLFFMQQSFNRYQDHLIATPSPRDSP